MANKKSKKEEIDFRPKALVYALSEDMKKETLDYAERWGYNVVHKVDSYKKELIELIEEVMRLYRIEKFDYLIMPNLFYISDNIESIGAFCILLSDFNITLLTTKYDEGVFGTNYIFDVKKVDTQKYITHENTSAIFLNEDIDVNLDITERNLWSYAIRKNYGVVKVIKFKNDTDTDFYASEVFKTIMKNQEETNFERIIILNHSQLAESPTTFLSVCDLLFDSGIVVDTLYRGSFYDWNYTIKKD